MAQVKEQSKPWDFSTFSKKFRHTRSSKQTVSQHTGHNNTNEWNFKIKLDGYLKNYDSSSKRKKNTRRSFTMLFSLPLRKGFTRLRCEDY